MGYLNIQPGSSPLVRYEMEYQPTSQIQLVPSGIKALIVLYSYNKEPEYFNVKYIGYADGKGFNTARAILSEQQQLNGRMWSHFSVYELWDHLQKNDDYAVNELFRQIYRRDSHSRSSVTMDKKKYTGNDLFVPKQLFFTFIESISKPEMQIKD